MSTAPSLCGWPERKELNDDRRSLEVETSVYRTRQQTNEKTTSKKKDILHETKERERERDGASERSDKKTAVK